MDDALRAELDRLGEPMDALSEPRLFRGMIYGDPGAGKTDLAVKLAHIITEPEDRIVLVTSDSAWVTVLKYPEIAARTTKLDFQGFSQLRTLAEAREEGESAGKWGLTGTVIWDTVSRSTDRILRNLVDDPTNRRRFVNDVRHPELEGYPHYRLVERGLGKTVKALNQSKLNIIYTAHIREPSEQDRAKRKTAIRPNMPEASFKVVAEEVALIGWLAKEETGAKRLIQLEGTKQVTAKSQISTIPEATYEVNQLPEMLAKWKAG